MEDDFRAATYWGHTNWIAKVINLPTAIVDHLNGDQVVYQAFFRGWSCRRRGALRSGWRVLRKPGVSTRFPGS
jgi:hypothetical protein